MAIVISDHHLQQMCTISIIIQHIITIITVVWSSLYHIATQCSRKFSKKSCKLCAIQLRTYITYNFLAGSIHLSNLLIKTFPATNFTLYGIIKINSYNLTLNSPPYKAALHTVFLNQFKVAYIKIMRFSDYGYTRKECNRFTC